MAESADALASGASPRKGVEVQVLLSAPNDFINDEVVFYCNFDLHDFHAHLKIPHSKMNEEFLI